MDPPLYLLPHAPKCAGSTVQRHFLAQLGAPAAIFVHTRAEQARWARSRRLPPALRAQVRLLGGHRLPRSARHGFAGRAVRECLLIRDPVSFNVSMYNFLLAQPPEDSGIRDVDFATWYAGYRRNRITRFLLRNYFQFSELAYHLMPPRARLRYLSERLSSFWFVGAHTDCGALIARISCDLGVSGDFVRDNAAPPGALKPRDLPPTLATRILEDNALDAALYERWGRRSQRADGESPPA